MFSIRNGIWLSVRTTAFERTGVRDAAEFNRRVKGDGVGFAMDRGRWRKPELVRIQRVEAQHQLMQGDNGAGKTIAMFALADQFEAAGETCIYYDPECQFLKRYWKPGDLILGPDLRSASFNPSDEIDYSTAPMRTLPPWRKGKACILAGRAPGISSFGIARG